MRIYSGRLGPVSYVNTSTWELVMHGRRRCACLFPVSPAANPSQRPRDVGGALAVEPTCTSLAQQFFERPYRTLKESASDIP